MHCIATLLPQILGQPGGNVAHALILWDRKKKQFGFYGKHIWWECFKISPKTRPKNLLQYMLHNKAAPSKPGWWVADKKWSGVTEACSRCEVKEQRVISKLTGTLSGAYISFFDQTSPEQVRPSLISVSVWVMASISSTRPSSLLHVFHYLADKMGRTSARRKQASGVETRATPTVSTVARLLHMDRSGNTKQRACECALQLLCKYSTLYFWLHCSTGLLS